MNLNQYLPQLDWGVQPTFRLQNLPRHLTQHCTRDTPHFYGRSDEDHKPISHHPPEVPPLPQIDMKTQVHNAFGTMLLELMMSSKDRHVYLVAHFLLSALAYSIDYREYP
ncbi:hypothetical protein ACHAXM_002688 [Skeletonema potamos]